MSAGPQTAAQKPAQPSQSASDDERLALAVAQHINAGDQHAAGQPFMELYERHFVLLRAFVASRAGRSDADDVTQEIWQRVWQYLPTRFRGGNFRAWLHEIARNYLIDCSRRQKSRPHLMAEFSDQTDRSAENPGNRLDVNEESAALKHCLEKLGEQNAEAVQIIRGISAGESYAQICQRSSIAKERAYTLFHQAKKQLSECVERTFEMTLHVLEIPDEATELPRWLERQLIGDDLAALVAQLEVIHGTRAGPAPTIDELLGGKRAAVMREGLSALSTEQLGQLLVHPRLLLDLQETLLLEGGPNWTRQAGNSTKVQDDLSRGRRRMSRYIATQSEAPRSATIPMPQKSPWSRREVLVALASAAAVLIAVFGYQASITGPAAPPESAVAWGWAKPGALPGSGSREEYLRTLAASAQEWFKTEPTTAPDLAKRIAQLRQGCSTLIMANHKPLPPADKAWLIERCKVWAKKFDDQLAAVEAGDDVAKVREATNETVNNLINALNAKANEPVTL